MVCLLLLLSVEVIAFLISFTLNKQDIMAPSVMVSSVFIFSTVLALYNAQKWNIEFGLDSFAILSIGIMTFVITDIWVANSKKHKITNYSVILEPINVQKRKIIALIALDVFITFMVYKEVLRIAATNTWFTNAYNAYRVISSHTDKLTAEQYMKSWVNQSIKIVIVSGFLCAALFINNVIVCKQKVKKNILLIIPPIILCIMTLFTGMRSNIMRLFVFSLIYSYIMIQIQCHWIIKVSWRFIRVIAVSVVLILLLFGSSQSFLGRSGSTDIISVISNYAGAPILHFNQFIHNPPPANSVFGQETFAGVWNLLYKLGIVSKAYSAHLEYRYISSSDYGNVYTIFRRFIQDFGVFGMIIMTGLLGVVFSYVYNRLIKYRGLSYKKNIYIIEYCYLYFIIAMASIDNFIHDYINIGTLILVVLLHVMCWWLMKSKVIIKSQNGHTVIR